MSAAPLPVRSYSLVQFRCRGPSPRQRGAWPVVVRHLRSWSQARSSGLGDVTAWQQTRAQQESAGSLYKWLYGCCACVVGMVAIGGWTRLTGSGLSMVEWKFTGLKPPMGAQEWEAEFEKFKNYPQFQEVYQDMTVGEFRTIYWWEWGHRMAGRVTGLVFALPFAYHVARGRVGARLGVRLTGLLCLGGMQGVVGWWMVKSGLEEANRSRVHLGVSAYRLSTHLGMAFVLYSSLLVTASRLHLEALAARSPELSREGNALLAAVPRRVRLCAYATAGLVGATAYSGALVAGNHGGMVYNDFPLMGGSVVPSDYLNPYLSPVWRNAFEHDVATQFNHRVLACTTFGSVSTLFWLSRSVVLPPRARLLINGLMGVAMAQVSLGVSTLIYACPVPLASAHQMGSLALLTIALGAVQTLRPTGTAVTAGLARSSSRKLASTAATAGGGPGRGGVLAR